MRRCPRSRDDTRPDLIALGRGALKCKWRRPRCCGHRLRVPATSGSADGNDAASRQHSRISCPTLPSPASAPARPGPNRPPGRRAWHPRDAWAWRRRSRCRWGGQRAVAVFCVGAVVARRGIALGDVGGLTPHRLATTQALGGLSLASNENPINTTGTKSRIS